MREGISSGRVYVHVVKFIGALCPCCEIHGDYVHLYKNEQRGEAGLSGRGGGGGGGRIALQSMALDHN